MFYQPNSDQPQQRFLPDFFPSALILSWKAAVFSLRFWLLALGLRVTRFNRIRGVAFWAVMARLFVNIMSVSILVFWLSFSKSLELGSTDSFGRISCPPAETHPLPSIPPKWVASPLQTLGPQVHRPLPRRPAPRPT